MSRKPTLITDEEYAEWFKEFVQGWRCRICKTDLNINNFGGIGDNHMIFCKDCKNGYEKRKNAKNHNEK